MREIGDRLETLEYLVATLKVSEEESRKRIEDALAKLREEDKEEEDSVIKLLGPKGRKAFEEDRREFRRQEELELYREKFLATMKTVEEFSKTFSGGENMKFYDDQHLALSTYHYLARNLIRINKRIEELENA